MFGKWVYLRRKSYFFLECFFSKSIPGSSPLRPPAATPMGVVLLSKIIKRGTFFFVLAHHALYTNSIHRDYKITVQFIPDHHRPLLCMGTVHGLLNRELCRPAYNSNSGQRLWVILYGLKIWAQAVGGGQNFNEQLQRGQHLSEQTSECHLGVTKNPLLKCSQDPRYFAWMVMCLNKCMCGASMYGYWAGQDFSAQVWRGGAKT